MSRTREVLIKFEKTIIPYDITMQELHRLATIHKDCNYVLIFVIDGHDFSAKYYTSKTGKVKYTEESKLQSFKQDIDMYVREENL